MNFIDLARRRCSIRQYAQRAVEADKLEYVLEAARLAPSAVNYQPWQFLVVTSAEGLSKIKECYPREWMTSAPACILVCADHQQSWKRKSDGKDHADIDIAIATEHICLAAAEQGLGTCWVCNFDTERCRSLFRIPDHLEPVVLVPIGYPESENLWEETPKKRKDSEELIRYESF